MWYKIYDYFSDYIGDEAYLIRYTSPKSRSGWENNFKVGDKPKIKLIPKKVVFSLDENKLEAFISSKDESEARYKYNLLKIVIAYLTGLDFNGIGSGSRPREVAHERSKRISQKYNSNILKFSIGDVEIKKEVYRIKDIYQKTMKDYSLLYALQLFNDGRRDIGKFLYSFYKATEKIEKDAFKGEKKMKKHLKSFGFNITLYKKFGKYANNQYDITLNMGRHAPLRNSELKTLSWRDPEFWIIYKDSRDACRNVIEAYIKFLNHKNTKHQIKTIH